MIREQINQREAIMQQLWSVEDRASTPHDPTLKAAARGAVSQLRALLATVGYDFRDPLNAGKTWRYLGDAYFTLSGKTDETSLRLARQAYLKAEKILADAHDTLESAKLDFNLANTTRLLDGGRNRELLEEARRRYYDARKAFARVMPEAVASVENSLESLEIVIKGLDFLKTAGEGYHKTNSLKQKLEAAGNDPEQISRIAREFEKLKVESRSPEDEVRSFQS
jgi:HEPN domain-containing protein